MVQMNFSTQALMSQGLSPSTGGMDVFETGEFLFHITGSKTAETRKKDGIMLVLTATCLEEGQASKKVDIRLNVQNPSAQAVEIAMRDLMAISMVCGVPEWSDTQQLHGRPFRIRLEKTTYKNDKGEERPTNEIKGFADANGNAPGENAGGGGAPAAPVAQPAAPAAPAAQPAAPAAPAAPVAQPAAQPAAPAAPAVPSGVPTPPWGQNQQNQ